MAKTLDEAGVKRLIQEIKGANKNLNAPIPISTENTPESMAQNVKNIADYVEKAKAAGIDTTKSFRLTLEIEGYPVEGSYDIQYSYAYGLQITDDGYALLYNIDVTTGEVFTPCEIVTARSIQKVTSDMLAKGARKPIILTPSTTEVDEETYQKLLSDDVDVVFKSADNEYCSLTYKYDGDTDCNFYFTVLSAEGGSLEEVYLYGYNVTINHTAPHKAMISTLFDLDIYTLIDNSGFINKSALSPILQEIDLTGTDEDRKAKLDQFEADWKALTGASDLTGARFVGYYEGNSNSRDAVDLIISTLLVWDSNEGSYHGLGVDDSGIKRLVYLGRSGIITCANIMEGAFSHLEAITIKTGNTPDDKAANVAAIKAYVDNLIALGVDVTKGYTIPLRRSDMGYIGIGCGGTNKRLNIIWPIDINSSTSCVVETDGTFKETKILTLTGAYNITTTSKQIVGAINEVNALAKSKQDALTSGTNIKTVNGQSLLGSGDIAISGGGDVTKAGNNIFTGNNTFTTFVHFSRGIEITNANEDMHYYLDLDSNTNKFRISDDSDMDVEVTGVDTPTQDNAVANKKYVDDKVAAGGVANKLTVTNFDSNSGRPINIQDTDLNDVLYVENSGGQSYKGPQLTIMKYNNGSGNGSYDAYKTDICGKGIQIGKMSGGDYVCETIISSGNIKLYGSDVVTKKSIRTVLPIGTQLANTTTTETIRLTSDVSSAHRIILANPSGTKTIQLPANPYDGETFEIIRIEGVSFTLTNNSGKAMQKCTGTTTVTSMNISSSGKYTCIYSSLADRWYVMRDDFVSF